MIEGTFPGQRVYWKAGGPSQIVDVDDPKLSIAKPITSNDLRLIVTHNGQLVWVRLEDLEDDEQYLLGEV